MRERETWHVPVMVNEVQHFLITGSTKVIVDCTVELDPQRLRREKQVKHDSKTVAYRTSETTDARSSKQGSPGGNIGYTAQTMNTPRTLSAPSNQGTQEEEKKTQRQEMLSPLSDTQIETETVGMTPDRVRVAVGVPFRDAYRQVAERYAK